MIVAFLSIFGAVVGVVLRFYVMIGPKRLFRINLLGTLLVRALRGVCMPYICCSATRGVACCPPLNKRNIIRLLLAVITTLISMILGFTLVALLIPGLNVPGTKPFIRPPSVAEFIWSWLSGNPWRIQFHEYRDQVISSIKMVHSEENQYMQFLDWPNHISIIMASLMLGPFMRSVQGHNLGLETTVALHECTKVILYWIYGLLFPAAVTFSLVFTYKVTWDQLFKLAIFVAVVLLGLLLLGCLLLLLYLAMVQKNPLTLLKRIWTTTRVKELLFSFFPPREVPSDTGGELMNGTVLYGAAVVLFINNFHRLELGLPHFCNMCLVVLIVCSVGGEGKPSTGSLTTIFLLSILNLPLNAAGLLLVAEVPLRLPQYLVNRLSHAIGEEVADRWLQTRKKPL